MSTGPARAADAEEWISRADAAEPAPCSVATTIRDEDDHDLDTRRGPSGQKLLRLADLIRMDRIGRKDLPTGAPAELRPGPADRRRARARRGPRPAGRARRRGLPRSPAS